MISEQAVQIMEEYADDAAKMIATFREMGRERGELEGFESSWRALIEVARLLNSDARLRDALVEARDRAARHAELGLKEGMTPTEQEIAMGVHGIKDQEHDPDLCDRCREIAEHRADPLGRWHNHQADNLSELAEPDEFVTHTPRSELAAEDEYVAAGTGPLAGEPPVTLADLLSAADEPDLAPSDAQDEAGEVTP